MILGVPIIPFTIVFMVVMLISFWTTILLAVLLIPIIIVMREITKTDDQQFRLLWIKILCRYNLYHDAKQSVCWMGRSGILVFYGRTRNDLLHNRSGLFA